LPQDEFYNRTLVVSKGNKELINDRYGLSIEYKDVLFIDFLKEQIINNTKAILFDLEKYKPKELAAIETLDDIIIKNIYDVTKKYAFNDFSLATILNLISKQTTKMTKAEMENKFTAKKIYTDKVNTQNAYAISYSKIIEAQKKFTDSFSTSFTLDYPLYVNTEIVGKTFWIYVATEKPLLTVSSRSSVGG